ncbi:MAG: hypothetical protein GY757_55350, partial [bacterium]|nr:hypothetical protein [bacterium]
MNKLLRTLCYAIILLTATEHFGFNVASINLSCQDIAVIISAAVLLIILLLDVRIPGEVLRDFFAVLFIPLTIGMQIAFESKFAEIMHLKAIL